MDSLPVLVEATDLGTMLNVNLLDESALRTLFQNVLGDYVLADQLAQAISDWRDPDDIPRTRGAEHDEYVKAGLLRLPTNQPFRDIEELLDVKGMTPDVFAAVRPYLTTIGNAPVNLNAAPIPVLRVLPGMTDEILANILQMRSRGARITSQGEVMPRQRRGFSGRVADAMRQNNDRVEQQLVALAGVDTEQVLLTILARTSDAAHPVRLRVVVERGNRRGQPSADVTSEEWR